MSAVVGPLRRVWFNDGMTNPRYYDLPKNTLDPRYEACADHHPACDCREATIAEDRAELVAEHKAMSKAILDAIKGHQTYAATPDGFRDEFGMCKCPACGIARAARIGYWEWKRQRGQADMSIRREAWKREHRATLAPVYPYHDLVEMPF